MAYEFSSSKNALEPHFDTLEMKQKFSNMIFDSFAFFHRLLMYTMYVIVAQNTDFHKWNQHDNQQHLPKYGDTNWI